MVAPLKLVSPLLKAPFLSPPSAYDFIKARAAADLITEEVQYLMQCIMGCLQEPAPTVNTLEAIDLEDCLTSIRLRLLRALLTEEKCKIKSSPRDRLPTKGEGYALQSAKNISHSGMAPYDTSFLHRIVIWDRG